jgi:hypothetical protein
LNSQLAVSGHSVSTCDSSWASSHIWRNISLHGPSIKEQFVSAKIGPEGSFSFLGGRHNSPIQIDGLSAVVSDMLTLPEGGPEPPNYHPCLRKHCKPTNWRNPCCHCERWKVWSRPWCSALAECVCLPDN